MPRPCLFLTAATALLLMWGAAPHPARAQDSPQVVPEDSPPTAALETTPEVRRAVAAMRAQQWKAARSAWEEVLQLEPENAAAFSNLGKVQYQLADHPAARKSLEKATALKPDLADSWLTLGLVYLELKAPMMAVSAMTRGVSENPADPRAHNSLAIVLKRVGWTTGAESELQKALDLDPDYAEAHFNLAVMHLERMPPSLEMAGRHYRKARLHGAAPDELVEQQIRGESAVEEADSSPDDTAAAPAIPADSTASPSAMPARATPVAGPAKPSKKSPPRKPTSSPQKSPSP